MFVTSKLTSVHFGFQSTEHPLNLDRSYPFFLEFDNKMEKQIRIGIEYDTLIKKKLYIYVFWALGKSTLSTSGRSDGCEPLGSKTPRVEKTLSRQRQRT